MSLFIGNVSKHVSHRQLENLFKKFGKCKIDLRDRYAFVQFDIDNCAQAARTQLQHDTFHGLQLNIEWSKNSGRFGENNKRKQQEGERKRSRSRQNRWKRDDRWGRRSPSNQRRSPSYSANKDIETFVPVCPRDQIILKKLTDKAKQKQNRHRDSGRRDVQVPKNTFVVLAENSQHQNKEQATTKQNGIQLEKPANSIEQEEGVIHQDGQIPAQ